MQFVRSKVQPQMKLMVAKLVQDKHIDIVKTARVELEKRLAKCILRYISDYEKIDEKAYEVLAQHDVVAKEFYKRVVESVSKEEGFPLESDALDLLNVELEKQLWDDDAVEEIFSDTLTLVATVTPYLKAMARF